MALYTDLSYLKELTDDDEALITESLQRYLSTSPVQLNKLIESTNNKEWGKIHDSAHSLFATTQIVGLTVIANPLKEIQTVSRESMDYDFIKERVEFVVSVIRQSYSEIKDYLFKKKG